MTQSLSQSRIRHGTRKRERVKRMEMKQKRGWRKKIGEGGGGKEWRKGEDDQKGRR